METVRTTDTDISKCYFSMATERNDSWEWNQGISVIRKCRRALHFCSFQLGCIALFSGIAVSMSSFELGRLRAALLLSRSRHEPEGASINEGRGLCEEPEYRRCYRALVAGLDNISLIINILLCTSAF